MRKTEQLAACPCPNAAAGRHLLFCRRATSEARKKAWADPEVRAKMSEARKKAWADPEVRAKMSEASKKALADPEVRAKMSEASKKALADPEVRARILNVHREHPDLSFRQLAEVAGSSRAMAWRVVRARGAEA